MLSISPKPWVNGDSLVTSDDPITGKIVLVLSFSLGGSVKLGSFARTCNASKWEADI